MPSPPLDVARESMLKQHLMQRGITSQRVLRAFRDVPREKFVSNDLRSHAYDDKALAIDCEQTISQPYIVALMTAALDLRGDETVLEVGTGSGYQTAILAELAQCVITLERCEMLSRSAATRLSELGYSNVACHVADGRQGFASAAPFTHVLIAAAADACPVPLWEQLAEGGTLVAPLGGSKEQLLQVIRKQHGKPMIRPLTPCRFVPLRHGLQKEQDE